MTKRELEIGKKVLEMNNGNWDATTVVLQQLGYTEEQIQEVMQSDDAFGLGRIKGKEYLYVTTQYTVGAKVFADDTFDWYLGNDENVYHSLPEAETAAKEMAEGAPEELKDKPVEKQSKIHARVEAHGDGLNVSLKDEEALNFLLNLFLGYDPKLGKH